MLAFKPLFQHDIYGGIQGQRRSGTDTSRGMAEQVTPTPSVVSADQIQVTLTQAYQRMQSTVQSRFPAVEGTGAAANPTAADDYSPQAVADRIVGFITDRLTKEQANGASPERLKSLYQAALKGVEQGLREGRNIIQDQGLFEGSTKDTFYQTVNRIADGLTQLGEQLFGVDLDGSEGASAAGKTQVKQSSSVSGAASTSAQVQVDRSRRFEMEVMTREGDKVKILVNSGQSFSSNQSRYNDGGSSIHSFEASFSSFDNLSFQVEGDLNESELAALNDLFSQVNDVAATFYGGDVEAAFNQALDVGMNPEQLASFAVNINQADAVTVRDTYMSVQNMAGSSYQNPYQDLFDALAEFAKQVKSGADVLEAIPEAPTNLQALYTDLIGGLHSDAGQQEGKGEAFQRFTNRLAG